MSDKVYYIKGWSQTDGVGEYTFIAPITGTLYIRGSGSTAGYYLKRNGTTMFTYSAGANQAAGDGHAIEVKQGDIMAIYSQGAYVCFLTDNIDTNMKTFATNIPR